MKSIAFLFAAALVTTATVAVAPAPAVAAAPTANIAGTWTTSFESQVGMQNYTYSIAVDGNTLTGHAKSNLGEGDLSEGKVNGDTVTFIENLKIEGMELRIDYKGKIDSGDEIKFTRQVADVATEELVAKRVK